MALTLTNIHILRTGMVSETSSRPFLDVLGWCVLSVYEGIWTLDYIGCRHLASVVCQHACFSCETEAWSFGRSWMSKSWDQLCTGKICTQKASGRALWWCDPPTHPCTCDDIFKKKFQNCGGKSYQHSTRHLPERSPVTKATLVKCITKFLDGRHVSSFNHLGEHFCFFNPV